MRGNRAFDMLTVAVSAGVFVWLLPSSYGWGAAVLGGSVGAALRWMLAPPYPSSELGDKRPRRRTKAPEERADVFAALPIPLLLIDHGGVVIRANREAREILMRDLEGVPISLIFRSPTILAAVDHALKEGQEEAFEFRIRRPRDMTLGGATRVLAEGAQRQVVLALEDKTDRVLIEETRSDFVANASHELRTPLAAISGLVETLQGPAKDDPAAQDKFLGMIAKQTVRMTRLVNDLLSLSRIEADENILPATEQDIEAIVSEALATMQPLADARGAQVRADLSGERLMVRGSRDELNQVFVNLIENALKYAGDAGPIRVAVARRGTMARITVSDKGAGIDPEHIPRLTERFFRVDPIDSRARGGTGLGLAIVKHIINRHRGTLEISSVPGNGADFIVSLPVSGGAQSGAS